MSGNADRAKSSSSSSLREDTGCGTYTAPTWAPRASFEARTASVNASVATTTPGNASISNELMSCRLHDVQEPQSARAAITRSHRAAISRRTSGGAVRVKVGLRKRSTLAPRASSRD